MRLHEVFLSAEDEIEKYARPIEIVILDNEGNETEEKDEVTINLSKEEISKILLHYLHVRRAGHAVTLNWKSFEDKVWQIFKGRSKYDYIMVPSYYAEYLYEDLNNHSDPWEDEQLHGIISKVRAAIDKYEAGHA